MVEVDQNATYDVMLEACFSKMNSFNSHLIPSTRTANDYELCYRSLKTAKTIPGSDKPFVLKVYKEAVGNPYSQLSFVLKYKASGRFVYANHVLLEVKTTSPYQKLLVPKPN